MADEITEDSAPELTSTLDPEEVAAPQTTTAAEYAPSSVLPLWQSLLLLVVAAAWSPVSQLVLTPTHGAIPAAFHHSKITINVLLATVPLDIVFLQLLPVREKAYFLPVVAYAIPMIQTTLLPYSDLLGPSFSAFMTELSTYGLLLALTMHITWQSFNKFVPAGTEDPLKTFGPPAAAGLFVYLVQMGLSNVIPGLIGRHALLTRAYLPVTLATLTAAIVPSTYLLYAGPPLFHTLFLNSHTPSGMPLAVLNTALDTVNFTLLDRQDSVTGYLSVLQNNEEGYRVMRCDHSLLGGEWVPGVGKWPGGAEVTTERRAVVGEPVYTVFVMLEAIRLVQEADVEAKAVKHLADADASALVIGLGIGTTPSALVAHGIQTTVVEIDPVVFKFAQDYFDLPTNLTGIEQDALSFVRITRDKKYDYIVHDVFTGGAEPVELFTVEFIKSLHRLLSDDGVIAINYAGDLTLPPAALIVRSILSVFPNCRLFREDEPKETDQKMDFTNIVFFCRKSDKPFTFREPIERDFLGTQARRHALVPKHEVDTKTFDLTGEKDGTGKVLSLGKMSVMNPWQVQGAVGHWKVMRTVMPPVVWNNW